MLPGAAFPHEKLDAWRMAKELAVSVYQHTAHYPGEERFGLVNQLRRAAVSVMSNLAEDSGRASYRDQAPFSQLAYGSLLEMDAQLQLSVDLNYLQLTDYIRLRESTLELAKKISALRSSHMQRANSVSSGVEIGNESRHPKAT